jgi:hypothetical protein
MHIVRYADDFKIFCRNKNDANKIFHAVKDWLKQRLKLDISEEKSKIVNLKNSYSEFLGFKLKLERKGKKKNNKPKYVVKSHISEKAQKQIIMKAKDNIKNIERQVKQPLKYSAVSNYAAFAMGEHNYYRIATHCSKDFSHIGYMVNKVLNDRLKPKSKKAKKHWKYPKEKIITDVLWKRYGKSKQMRWLEGRYGIIPLTFCQFQKPRYKRKQVNCYTKEGLAYIHENLKLLDIEVLIYLMKNHIKNRSIEYNDNRLSLYSA